MSQSDENPALSQSDTSNSEVQHASDELPRIPPPLSSKSRNRRRVNSVPHLMASSAPSASESPPPPPRAAGYVNAAICVARIEEVTKSASVQCNSCSPSMTPSPLHSSGQKWCEDDRDDTYAPHSSPNGPLNSSNQPSFLTQQSLAECCEEGEYCDVEPDSYDTIEQANSYEVMQADGKTISTKFNCEDRGNNSAQRHSKTAETFAEWFRDSETEYVNELSKLMDMANIIQRYAVGDVSQESAEEATKLSTLVSKLEVLKSAVMSMQQLASDLAENLDTEISKWKRSSGALRFIHIYCTRGQVLKLYPTAWFAILDDILQQLSQLRLSAHSRLFSSIQEATGKEYTELLQCPCAHLCKYRSKLESYLDCLEEPQQQMTFRATDECKNALYALELVTEIIESEDPRVHTRAMVRLAELFRNSTMPSRWLEPSRKLIQSGNLQVAGKDCAVYLFNDFLLLLLVSNDKKQEKVESFEEVASWAVTSSHGPVFELAVWPSKRKYIFTAKCESECSDWLAALAEVKSMLGSSEKRGGSKVSLQKAGMNRWVPDEQCSQCAACAAHFTASCRRHHCRHCGNIFCSKCTPTEMWIKYANQKQRSRTCVHCYQLYVSANMKDRLLQSSARADGGSLLGKSLLLPRRSLSVRSAADSKSVMSNERVTTVDFYQPQTASRNGSSTSSSTQVWQSGQLCLIGGLLIISKQQV